MDEQPSTENTDTDARKFGSGPFREVIDLGNQWLVKQLLETLKDVDKNLNEMATQSRSNASQNYYFQAVSHLRQIRRDLTNNWQQNWLSRFDANTEAADGDDQQAELKILDKDTHEEDVRIRVIAEKAMERDEQGVWSLNERTNVLQEQFNFTPQQNPFSPHVLMDTCRNALDGLDLDLQLRLQIYQAFERCLLRNLTELLDTCNTRLVEAGVLQHLEPRQAKPGQQPKRPEESPAPDKAPLVESDPQAQSGEQAFSALRELLQGRTLSSPATAPAAAVPASSGPPAMSTGDLLTALAELQKLESSASGAAGVPLPLGQRVSNHLGGNGDTQGRAASIDADTITLVSMLFDALNQQGDLAPPMVALLSRLQIPILRMALTDRAVFADQQHPARQLLNEIAQASEGWTQMGELEQDKLYQQVDQTVEQVCNANAHNADLFQTALNQFSGYAKAARRKAQLLQQRLASAERARAHVNDARRVVARVLERRVARTRLTPAALDFVNRSMSRWLQLVYIREGVESEDWKYALRQINAFFAAYPESDGHNADCDVQQFDALLDELVKLLEAAGQDSFELDELRHTLGAERGRLLTQLAEADTALPPATDSDALEDAVSGNGDTAIAPAVAATAVPADDTAALDEIEQAEELPDDESAIAAANELAEGAWCRLTLENEEPVRSQLAVILPPHGTRVFMNRYGQKIAELSVAQLAWAYHNGSIEAINDNNAFDQALETVILNLQQSRR